MGGGYRGGGVWGEGVWGGGQLCADDQGEIYHKNVNKQFLQDCPSSFGHHGVLMPYNMPQAHLQHALVVCHLDISATSMDV